MDAAVSLGIARTEGKSRTETELLKSGDFCKPIARLRLFAQRPQCNSFVIRVFIGCLSAQARCYFHGARMRRAPVMPQSSHRSFLALACLPVIFIGLAVQMDASERTNAIALQEVVDSLKAQLGINASVSVAIVETNSLLVSVQPVDGESRKFRMDFEGPFLPSLDQDNLKAIVAHELGHVWIYTHHPYLQTELLANTVAMRAVPRASLERVYGKVWEHQGIKGDLVRFLGPE